MTSSYPVKVIYKGKICRLIGHDEAGKAIIKQGFFSKPIHVSPHDLKYPKRAE